MIGVIADDLTGAAEIGAVALRHGLRAEIVRTGKPSGRADVVCMDADSRSCPAGEAGNRAAAAARELRAAGAQWIYKKVDSVLRGQVTAEMEAVMRELKLSRALLLPANPSLGRTIRNGHYFVHGKLIHKTEFARDPEYPRRSSQVLHLLKVPEEFSIRLVKDDRQLFDRSIVIGEASLSGDVGEWAAIFEREGTLAAGGAEFFNALLDLEKPAAGNGAKNPPPSPPGRELFVCGVSTVSSRKFLSAARRSKQPVFTLPVELIWGAEFTPATVAAVTRRVVAAFESHSRVILAVGLPNVRHLEVAKRLSRNVVELAERVIKSVSVARVFAEGGATAAELVRRMGWSRLTVERELAPGVATLTVEHDQPLLLTIKPGTYAWPAQWT
jgi:D-threonate/D-erythronate kinase